MIKITAISGKLSFRLIVLQMMFLYLFSNASARLYYTLHYEFFECFYRYGKEAGLKCFEKYQLPTTRVSDFLVGPIYMMLYGLLLAAMIIAFVNWIRKKHGLNTLLVLLLYVSMFLIGIFRFTKGLDLSLMKFAGFFTGKLWSMNLIVVQIYLITGVLTLWLSVKKKALRKT